MNSSLAHFNIHLINIFHSSWCTARKMINNDKWPLLFVLTFENMLNFSVPLREKNLWFFFGRCSEGAWWCLWAVSPGIWLCAKEKASVIHSEGADSQSRARRWEDPDCRSNGTYRTPCSCSLANFQVWECVCQCVSIEKSFPGSFEFKKSTLSK